MSTATVSIDRSSLPGSLSPLVISDDLNATYMLVQGGLGRPGITWRMTAAPDSAFVHGTEYVAAVKEESSLPLKVEIQAASSAALDTAITALTDAVSQFSYSVTVTVDGVAKTWSCAPAAYASASGLIERSRVVQHYDVFTITIPVYPISS